MSELQTIELEGIGSVTFRPLTKQQRKRLEREAAQRRPRGSRSTGEGRTTDQRDRPRRGMRDPLLPQPGGFEGFAPVPVSLASHDHAVTDCPQMGDPNLEPCTAGLPASGHPKEDEHSVLLVPEALRLRAKLPEHLSPVGEEPDDVLAAADRSLAHPAIRNPFGVAMRKLREGLRVTLAHRLVEPPHDLNVLLRHRLLPPPGGFEGLGAVFVFFVSDDPLIADCVDDSARVLDPRIAALELASFLNHRDNPFISAIDELDQLHFVLVPCVDPLLEYRKYFLGSANHPALGACSGHVVLDPRVRQLDEAFVVALDKGGDRSPDDLHVLLRHRPRSIS